MNQNDLILLGLNIGVCFWGWLICIRRLAMMSGNCTKPSIRTQYAIWISFFTASAISWTYDDPASFTQLCMSCCVLAHLLTGAKAWRKRPPPYTIKPGLEAQCFVSPGD